MKSVHILHHSVSPFRDQIPDKDSLHYNTGIPMLFARAIRSRYPEFQVEVWRPEHTLRSPYTWEDEGGIMHRIFPSWRIRYKIEVSLPLLKAAMSLVKEKQTYIWVHGIYNLHSYLLAFILKKTPTIAQSHGGFPALAMFLKSRHRLLRYLYLLLHPIEKHVFSQYPQIFVLSREEQHYFQEFLKIRANKITLSPTGVDFDHFSPGDRRKARTVCGLNRRGRIVLYVGRLAKEKGVRYLVKAFSSIVNRFKDAQLYIIGRGPKQHTLKRMALDLGLEKHVHFVGYIPQEELPCWYRSADITVIPQLEWFDKVSVESMACKTPVVMTKAGGALEIIKEFEGGVLVPAKNSDAIAEAVCQGLVSSKKFQPNIERARSMFDWSVKLSRAFEIFETMKNHSDL